jgi:hypothetical protein
VWPVGGVTVADAETVADPAEDAEDDIAASVTAVVAPNDDDAPDKNDDAGGIAGACSGAGT